MQSIGSAAEREPRTIGPLPLEDVGHLIDGLAPHQVQLVLGLDVATLAEQVALVPPSRPVLALDIVGLASVEAVIGAAALQLARALKSLWPHPWAEDFSAFRDDALHHAHLPIRLAEMAERLPRLSQAWARDAVTRLARGRHPDLSGTMRALNWAQLVLALSPRGLILVTSLQPDGAARQIRAIEWLAQHAPVSIVVLADRRLEFADIDRIVYGAREAVAAPPPPLSHLAAIADPETTPLVLTLPPAPEGRPHPMSPIEQKLHRLIQGDDELRPLLVFNKTVDLSLLAARVDIVWIDGRVAVEIDGHEHRVAAKFRADRHRDSELMCAGYRVLRMTNEDVATDAALAIEKIRDVVRLARREGR